MRHVDEAILADRDLHADRMATATLDAAIMRHIRAALHVWVCMLIGRGTILIWRCTLNWRGTPRVVARSCHHGPRELRQVRVAECALVFANVGRVRCTLHTHMHMHTHTDSCPRPGRPRGYRSTTTCASSTPSHHPYSGPGSWFLNPSGPPGHPAFGYRPLV